MKSNKVSINILRYIDEHIEEELSLKEISCEAGYSEFHFLRIFKDEMKMTLKEYITQRKLLKASEQIIDGRKIMDVAIQYGWESHAGFIKAFKKEFGFSPSLLRKKSWRLIMGKINNMSTVKQQYATANNLHTRISIHDKYSTNKMGFGNWIVSNYKIDKGMKVLELGCGTGEMWKERECLISLCSQLTLSDFSESMVAATRSNVGEYDNVEYIVIDIQEIPFEDETFDVVIANMMLYHVPDITKGLTEVRRVLKTGGRFYAATYGENGIIEYLAKILAMEDYENNLNKKFTLQNGYAILNDYFPRVEKLEYIDSLAVTNIDDLVEYIYSLSGMTSLNSVPKQVIKDILIDNMTNGVLFVPKEYGLFIASKEENNIVDVKGDFLS